MTTTTHNPVKALEAKIRKMEKALEKQDQDQNPRPSRTVYLPDPELEAIRDKLYVLECLLEDREAAQTGDTCPHCGGTDTFTRQRGVSGQPDVAIPETVCRECGAVTRDTDEDQDEVVYTEAGERYNKQAKAKVDEAISAWMTDYAHFGRSDDAATVRNVAQSYTGKVLRETLRRLDVPTRSKCRNKLDMAILLVAHTSNNL